MRAQEFAEAASVASRIASGGRRRLPKAIRQAVGEATAALHVACRHPAAISRHVW
jgi:hypothetical protein